MEKSSEGLYKTLMRPLVSFSSLALRMMLSTGAACEVAVGLGRQIERKRIHRDVVDPAAAIGSVPTTRRASLSPNGTLSMKLPLPLPLPPSVSTGSLEGAFVGVELGLVGDDLHRPAHGSRAIEGALRTAQHLDAADVVEVRIDHDLAGLRQRRRGERHFVEVEAHGGGRAAVGGETARLELRETRPRGAHGEPGHVVGHVRDG